MSVLLVAFVHRELTEAEERRVRDHLAVCSRCRDEYRSVRSVNRALKFMPCEDADTDKTT